MNGYSIPCYDKEKRSFLLEEELKMIVGCYDQISVPIANEFKSLASAFSSAFTGDFTTNRYSHTSWILSDLLFKFLRQACSDPNYKICICAHGMGDSSLIFNSTIGFDVDKSSSGCHMGKGVYVASSDYVPRRWATMRAYGPRASCRALSTRLSAPTDPQNIVTKWKGIARGSSCPRLHGDDAACLRVVYGTDRASA